MFAARSTFQLSNRRATRLPACLPNTLHTLYTLYSNTLYTVYTVIINTGVNIVDSIYDIANSINNTVVDVINKVYNVYCMIYVNTVTMLYVMLIISIEGANYTDYPNDDVVDHAV